MPQNVTSQVILDLHGQCMMWHSSAILFSIESRPYLDGCCCCFFVHGLFAFTVIRGVVHVSCTCITHCIMAVLYKDVFIQYLFIYFPISIYQCWLHQFQQLLYFQRPALLLKQYSCIQF